MHTTLKKARLGQFRRWKGRLAAIGLPAIADAPSGSKGPRRAVEPGQAPTITTARGALIRRTRPLLSFIAAMMAMRFLISLVYMKTNSVLLAQLMHATSTSALVVLSPAQASSRQEVFWYGVYAIALWCIVLAVVGIARRSVEGAYNERTQGSSRLRLG